MSKTRQLIGQTAVYGLSTIAARFINYLLIPFHTRVFLQQNDYGDIRYLYAGIAFLNVIFAFGMETAFFRFATSKENYKPVFGSALAILLAVGAVCTASLCLNAQSISAALNYPLYIIQFVIVIMVTDAISNLPFAKIRIEGRPWRYMFLKVSNVLVNVAANVFFLLPLYLNRYDLFASLGFTYNPAYGIGYVFLANLIASCSTLLLLIPDLISGYAKPTKELLLSLIKYGWPMIIIGLAGMVNETLDRILLKHFLPFSAHENAKQLGIYSAAYTLSIFMTLGIQAFRMGAEPFFFRQAKEKDAPKTYTQVMKYFVIACCVLFVGVSLYLDGLVYILGSHYREGKLVVPILLLANMCLGISYNLSVGFKISDKLLGASWVSVVAAGLTIILNIVFIPHIGYYASAVTTLIAYAFMALAYFHLSGRHYHVPYKTGNMISHIFLSIFFVGAFLLMQYFTQMSLTISLVTGTLMFALYLFVTIMADKELRQFLKTVVQKV